MTNNVGMRWFLLNSPRWFLLNSPRWTISVMKLWVPHVVRASRLKVPANACNDGQCSAPKPCTLVGDHKMGVRLANQGLKQLSPLPKFSCVHSIDYIARSVLMMNFTVWRSYLVLYSLWFKASSVGQYFFLSAWHLGQFCSTCSPIYYSSVSQH